MSRNGSNAAAEAFFKRLPDDALNEKEAELLDLLQRISSLMVSFLPRCVGLQEWAERRLHANLADSVNGSGIIFIQPAEDHPEPSIDQLWPGRNAIVDSQDAVATHCHVSQASNPSKENAGREDAAAKLITPVTLGGGLAGRGLCALPPKRARIDETSDQGKNGHLPTGPLLPEEQDVLHSILNLHWKRNTATFDKVEKASGVQAAFVALQAAWPSRPFSLKEWIEKRCMSNFKLFSGQNCGPMIERLPMTEELKAARLDAADNMRNKFLASLPQDYYTPEELELRATVLDFINNWKGDIIRWPQYTIDGIISFPTLSMVAQAPAVSLARQALLPPGASIAHWIEARCGAEFVLRKSRDGHLLIGLPGQLAEA